MNTYIEIYDEVLSTEECTKIIQYINQSPNMRRGLIGEGVDVKAKDSWDIHNRFQNQTTVDTMIHGALSECLADYKSKHSELNSIGYWSLENNYNLQKYLPGGGYFTSHCEANFRTTCQRVVVWMIYLNTVTDGGGTKFPQYDLVTDAVEGRVVLWPASWTHFHHGVVSPSQFKYITTGWYSFVPQ